MCDNIDKEVKTREQDQDWQMELELQWLINENISCYCKFEMQNRKSMQWFAATKFMLPCKIYQL